MQLLRLEGTLPMYIVALYDGARVTQFDWRKWAFIASDKWHEAGGLLMKKLSGMWWDERGEEGGGH